MEALRPSQVKKPKSEEPRRPALSPPDERRWWEQQLGVRLERLYTGERSGR